MKETWFVLENSALNSSASYWISQRCLVRDHDWFLLKRADKRSVWRAVQMSSAILFRFWHVWRLTYLSCTTEWRQLSVRQNVFYPVCLSLLNHCCKHLLSTQNNASGHFLLFIFVIAALNDYVIVASINVASIIVIAIRNSINCAALIGTNSHY